MLRRILRIALITDPLAVVCVLTMGMTTSLASLVDRTGATAHRIASFWGRILLFVSGVHVDAAGLERLPRAGGLVLVCNHQSMIDIPVLMAYLPVSFRFIAKKSLFRLPFIGWHLSLGGHIGVDRNDHRSAARSLAAARKKLKAGTSVLVFPEGSRSTDGLRPFKSGAAHLAIKSGATVVPIGLSGTRHALPRGSAHIRPTPIRLRVGEPISTATLSRGDQDRLTKTLQSSVEELIALPAPLNR